MAVKCCEFQFFTHILTIVSLVMFAGLMSGLTLGLMSMSLVELEVLSKSGTPEDRKHAGRQKDGRFPWGLAKILPVVQRQHLLLCTLLICNAAAMEALPIFLDDIVAPWVAILISVTLILLFGEIIPQSVCSRYGLAIGAVVAPFVRILVWICFPVAYPISKLLDALLGDGHEALLRRAELKTLVSLHGSEAGKGGELTRYETSIITGALELTEKTAKDSMTPMTETFAIDINEKLSRNLMESILEKGHSRVPVYYENLTNIIGLILVKNLLFISPEDEVLVKNVTIRKIPRVPEDMPLYNILNEFQKGHSHMAVVVRKHAAEPANEGTDLAKEVTLDVAGEDIYEEKKKQRKITVKRKKDLTSITQNSSRVNSKSRRWHRETSLDVLRLDENTKFAEAGEAIGIITMEDVMEELLQEEIYDETDCQQEPTHSPSRETMSSSFLQKVT